MKKHVGNFLYCFFGTAVLALGTGCSDDPPGNTPGGTGGSSGTGSGNELLTTEALSAGWVGGVPEDATDNPGGVQGAFYMYGDDGLSCELVEGNPCTAEGCCLSGSTQLDTTFAAWGCGIGLGLNDSGGDASVKRPFAGSPTAKFTYTITGNTGGNELRVGFTQFVDTTGLVSPYKAIPAFADTSVTGDVTFATALYPSWCSTSPDCLAPPDRTPAAPSMGAAAQYSHDIQFQIAGGERVGAFDFCITSIKVE